MAVRRVGQGMKNVLKTAASAAVDRNSKDLKELSDKIWRHPELGFEEHRAHQLLTDFLEGKGFKVQRSYTGLETAFRASFGSGRPHLCVICEYDALPGIGHACGHNLIAEAGVAAGLGLKAALEDKEREVQGTVVVMGTPAEEGGGGKVKLINNGAFEDMDVAMMVHPSPYSSLAPGFLAVAFLKAVYTGKAAHAAAFPWEGVNALDAAVLAYNNISVMRQQMKPSWRVHAIISEGGVKPNIIPNHTSLELMVRTPLREELGLLVDRVSNCLKSASTATGAKIAIEELAPSYDNLVSNSVLAELFGANWLALGTEAPMFASGSGSTDMGNVSQVVPSIHPKFQIGPGVGIHTKEFAVEVNTVEAHDRTIVVGKVMAHTCIDILTTDGLLERVKQEFDRRIIQ